MAKKINASALAKTVLKRVAHPRHLWNALKLHRDRPRTKRGENAELQLIGKILPGGFLHYGYFDDPDRQPEDVSLNDIVCAQLRYAELLADQIGDVCAPVLDVGCGMGGLIAVLQGRGFSPVALTPERTQIQYVRRTYPDVPAIHAKFEELAGSEHADHAGRYGTVITSESLQYLKLDQSLPLIASLLKPGGRWIACDCFQISGAAPSARESGTFSAGLTATKGRLNKTGHDWDTFRRAVDRAGWYIAYERDFTPNVLHAEVPVHVGAAVRPSRLPVRRRQAPPQAARHPLHARRSHGGAPRRAGRQSGDRQPQHVRGTE